jgi:hypothetical protein
MARNRKQISQEALCEIAGVTISRRREWARKKRLRAAGRAGYGEEDAVELAVLRVLVEEIGPTDAAIAWKQIRPKLKSAVQEKNLVALYDSQDKSTHLETSIQGLRAAHSYGHRTAIVDLADPIRRVRTAFGRLTDDS